MALHDFVDRHKADVVSILGVVLAGIAQPNQQNHESLTGRRGALPSPRRPLLWLRIFALGALFALGTFFAFFALDFFFDLGLNRRCGNRGDGEVAIGDDRFGATGEFDRTDSDAIADFEPFECGKQDLGDGPGAALQLDRMAHDVEHATQF